MAVQFGITRDSGTYGVVQNVETEDSIDTATYSDADGDVAAAHAFNRKQTLKCDFIYDSSSAPPAAGDTITINSLSWQTDSVTETEVTDDYRKVSINGTRWVTNDVPS